MNYTIEITEETGSNSSKILLVAKITGILLMIS